MANKCIMTACQNLDVALTAQVDAAIPDNINMTFFHSSADRFKADGMRMKVFAVPKCCASASVKSKQAAPVCV